MYQQLLNKQWFKPKKTQHLPLHYHYVSRNIEVLHDLLYLNFLMEFDAVI